MGKKRISTQVGEAALANLPEELPTAVRYLLQEIEIRYPGGTIELRVPPFGAVQCVAGLEHRRGTPPNVVEVTPELFIKLALGEISLQDVPTGSGLTLSGARAAEIASVFK
jgi:hypothetical protein